MPPPPPKKSRGSGASGKRKSPAAKRGAAKARGGAKPKPRAARSAAGPRTAKAKGARTSAAKATTSKARTPKAKARAGKGAARRKLSGDLWFRLRTRVQAGGYWLREKTQIAGRGLRSAGSAIAGLWSGRSTRDRRLFGGAAGLAALLAVLLFLPAPGIPCRISVSKECAPEDGAIAAVPADAQLYAHLTLDGDTEQYRRAGELAAGSADLAQLAQQLIAALPTPSGARIDFAREIAPWAEDDFAVALLPGPGGEPLPLFVAGVGDREGAEELIARIAPSAEPKSREQAGSSIDVYPGGFASAFAGGRVLFGSDRAVGEALRVESGQADGLEGAAAEVRDSLPEARFADLYLSASGVGELLAERGAGATQLDTFVDYGATRGLAASATAEEDGVAVNLVSELDPGRSKQSPTFLAELPEFEPELAGEAGSRALAYLEVGEIGPTLAGLFERAGAGAPGLVRSLRDLASDLRRQEGVDPLRDLLPALGGRAALVAEPTGGVPFASLIVDGVDTERAAEALARLQRPLLRSLSAAGPGRVLRFEESEVEGTTVRSVRVSPTVNLSYALFDDELVVSTDPAGIERVLDGGADLAGSEAYEAATGDLPEEVSALLFLNLDELLGLAERAGLAEDPLYASLSDDISSIGSVGLAVTHEDDQLRTELFVAMRNGRG